MTLVRDSSNLSLCSVRVYIYAHDTDHVGMNRRLVDSHYIYNTVVATNRYLLCLPSGPSLHVTLISSVHGASSRRLFLIITSGV